MKIKCEKSIFVKGLQAVSKGISSKNTIYALSGILIKAIDKKIIFIATDNEIAIKYEEEDVFIEEEGSIVLPGKYILEISRKLPETVLEMHTEGYTFYIHYDQSKFNVNGMDAESFPEFPVVESSYKGVFPLYNFSEDVRDVSVATSTDESRPLFTGILMETNGTDVRFTATDAHRLSTKASRWICENTTEQKSVIIPNKILQEIIRLEDDDHADLEAIIANQEVCFKCGKYTFISRLIEGKFPNYKQVIPADDKVKAVIEIDVDELLSVLERAFVLSKEVVKEHMGRINLSLDSGILTVESRSPEIGFIHEEIEVPHTGEPISLLLNVRHLLDVLHIVNTQKAEIKFTGASTPFVIQRKDDSNYIYLALPLRP